MTSADPPAWDAGPFDSALDLLRAADPDWAAGCVAMASRPWRSEVLTPRLVELISVGISVACTSLNAGATRRHIARALDVGATREDIVFVIKCATVMSIHSCSLGAPILLEEAKAAGIPIEPSGAVPTQACDAMKTMGQWNVAWDPFLELDPEWTDAFMRMGAGIYKSAPLTPKEIELLSIAFDASFTHMYAPGTRRHIQNALKASATPREIFTVLQICAAHGVQACNLGLPILEEEASRRNQAASAQRQGR